MRHVPTALFIDTEVFKRNALKLDTKNFASLKSTFVPGGLRLLLPSMMERELLRHYERQALKCAQQMGGLQKETPIKFLKSWTLRTTEEVKAECLEALLAQWDEFKKHFIVEPLPVLGDLEEVVSLYFAVKPPFSEPKPKEFPDAFVLSALVAYHKLHSVNIAVVSHDGDFRNACLLLPYVRHFASLEDYVAAFEPELSREEHIPEEPIDPLRPIVTEDLTELKGILGRGSQITPIEGDRLVSLLQNRGENYRYFFLNAVDPFWIPRLQAAGFFNTIPEIEQMPDGATKVPDWFPIYYLEKAFDADPEAVVRILEALPASSNPRALNGVISIAAKCESPELLSRLKSKILAAAEHPRWAHEKFVALLKNLAQW